MQSAARAMWERMASSKYNLRTPTPPDYPANPGFLNVWEQALENGQMFVDYGILPSQWRNETERDRADLMTFLNGLGYYYHLAREQAENKAKQHG